MNWLAGFKKAAHFASVGVGLAVGWAATHPELVAAVVKAYPKASVITTGLALVGGIYYSPKP